MGCALEICSAGMWPTKRGEGASPSHLSCISPLIQLQPLNLIFQHFSLWALCSVFSHGMCWRTQLIVKTVPLILLPPPPLSLPLLQSYNYHTEIHFSGRITQSSGDITVTRLCRGEQKPTAWYVLYVINPSGGIRCTSQNDQQRKRCCQVYPCCHAFLIWTRIRKVWSIYIQYPGGVCTYA